MSKSNSDDLGGWSSPEKPIAPKLNRSSISSYLSSLEVLLAIPLHPREKGLVAASIAVSSKKEASKLRSLITALRVSICDSRSCALSFSESRWFV
ncbi:hypothetical protein Ccrd_022942 [Cynara cardunculus var. scolymus]|uniref:Uncharacterized protein n=1 Tax=Cynara cardunculus var. scolymus TaxID=59895 RepID=A0A103XXX2_CYNCS|nr:hypothetical protein Ccrd_022942 [Cynara cardunculus var. scolymus]